MSNPLKLVPHIEAALKALAETDLSLIEQAAVFRLAAETCTQANIISEVATIMAKNRGPTGQR